MMKIRNLILVMGVLMSPLAASAAQVSIAIGTPHVSIGINVPAYPRLVRVPGHPVYYAPGLQANFFFYDGLYWVFHSDNWYASSWYNGPWWFVERLPRCRATSGSIRGISIPSKWSSSGRSTRSVTTTSGAIPSYRSSIRSATRNATKVSSAAGVAISVRTGISNGDDG